MAVADDEAPEAGWIAIADLHPHPRNYITHPPEQIEHLAESIREYGFVRNIVIARGDVILAGHGAVEAAQQVGYEKVPYMRVDHDADDPRAIKFLALENELNRFAERDDRALTELLRDVAERDTLLGTGYDDDIVAALVMVTRPEHEIENFDAAAHWVGLPEFESDPDKIKFVVQFDSDEDRDRFLEQTAIKISRKNRQTWSGWWPPRERADKKNLLFDG